MGQSQPLLFASQQPRIRVAQDVHGLHAFAALMIVLPVIALILLWPLPSLGFTIAFGTGEIVSITPDTPAESVGLHVGDRIQTIYSYAWSDADVQPMLVPLPWKTGTLVPLTVIRDGQVRQFFIPTQKPTPAEQSDKLIGFILTCVYWFTGYLFGIVKRQETVGIPLIAWFWLGLAGLIGTLQFALFISIILTIVVYWIIFTLWMPLSVAIHVWYPVRPTSPIIQQRTMIWLTGSIVVLQIVFVLLVMLAHFNVRYLTELLGTTTVIALGISFLCTSILLGYAYRNTTLPAVRRQIRLIAFACLVVACSWAGLRSIPMLLGMRPLLPGNWIDLISSSVPFAYMFGWVLTDLYRVDRLLWRFMTHLMTGMLLVTLVAIALWALKITGQVAVTWLILGVLTLYYPAWQVAEGLRSRHREGDNDALTTASYQLTTTLDQHHLLTCLSHGLSRAFADPALAIYLNNPDLPTTFDCVHVQRFKLPDTLMADGLLMHLPQHTAIIDSQTLYTLTRAQQFIEEETRLLHTPGIALWCPLRRQDSSLIGVVLLGMRGDLDPYRTGDIQNLARLLDAARLAFTNSLAFKQQQQAEQTIRALYQSLQQAQDATATWIARELHDEAINVHLRLIAQSLEELSYDEHVPARRAEFHELIAMCSSTSDALRMICEDIYPLGIDDPHGLHMALQRQVRRLIGRASVIADITIDGVPCAVPIAMQWEIIRITREAINNALKHAVGLSHIVVQLTYPSVSTRDLVLQICDNGHRVQLPIGRTTGLGMRSMQESARAIGGNLTYQISSLGGMAVCFSVCLAMQEDM